jgi:type I restriction enzyme S subunit
MYKYVGADHWTRTTVFDLARWKNGLAFKNINFSSSGRPVIKIAELKSGITNQTKFTDGQYDKRVFVRKGDMLFSWSGNPDTSINVFRWGGPEGWLNQHIYKITPHDGIDEDFLFFLLRWLRPRFAEIARNKQTTGLGHVTLQDFKNMMVGRPEMEEQRAIASCLCPLQDKININVQTNETLERMALSFFKDWFVEFGPTRAKAEGQARYLAAEFWDLFPDSLDDADKPVGWGERPVYAIADYVNGAAYKSMHFTPDREGLPVIKIAELKSGVTANTKFTTTDLGGKYLIDTEEILFSWSGNPDTSIDTFIWDDGPAWLNQHIFRVRKNGNASRPFIYFQLRQLKPIFSEIARNKQTTGLGHVTARDMKELMVSDPPQAIAEAFDGLAGPLFQRIVSNLLENRTLAGTLDLLLPKFMSGDIRLRDAEKAVEAVA